MVSFTYYFGVTILCHMLQLSKKYANVVPTKRSLILRSNIHYYTHQTMAKVMSFRR